MPVIRRCSPEGREELSTIRQRPEVPSPSPGIFPGHFAKLGDAGAEALVFGVYDGIGTERGDHATAPARLTQGPVGRKGIERRLRGGEDLDMESLEQRARPDFRTGRAVGDVVV